MAEEIIDSLLTPEKTELESKDIISKNSAANSESPISGHNAHVRSNIASIGSHHAGDSSTRNSSDKSDSVNSGRNVVPHYLRASTGSCHDLCKYGGKHSFEKAKKPLRRRIAKSLSSEMYTVEITVSGDKKKEKVVYENSETETKNHLPDTKSYSRDPKTSLDKEKTVRNQPVIDTKIRSPVLPSPGTKSKKIRSPDVSSPGTKSYSRKPKTSLDKEKTVKNDKTSTDTKNHSPHLPSPITKSYMRKPKISPNLASPDPPELVKSVSFPSKKIEGRVKQGSSSTDNKVSRAEKKTTYMPKQHPTAMKPVKLKPSSSSDYSNDTRGKGKRNSNEETGQNTRASIKSAKKVPEPTTAILSRKVPVIKTAYNITGRTRNPKLVLPLTAQTRIRRIKTKTSTNQKIPEKTLHVIKIETKNSVLQSKLNDHANSSLPSTSSAKSLSHGKTSSLSSYEEEENGEIEYSGDGLISDSNESLEIGKLPPVKENLQKKSLKKTRGVVVSEEKYSSPVKLKFRSGKVVDLQSDNSGPRKLRFRRARIVGAEEGKGALRRRILKKAGLSDAASGAELSSEKVVLKHQDVQGKKDGQGLFNNVIEETASKLVESRISKVRALVGAFETVISLQETKPSMQAIG
ncbi:hypothetical protein MIMGU_mgv1a002860mg [Erythranthe guttata]|uniref:Calmodulin-binding domain-containing protein n=1 Tax=Erythranthe guttata TaxID=4155 RepID=A0A022RUI1_ERYGU|nr:hypothetical protein MIMGU_mgv1a002860mg [Erythranthe guttata]